MSKAEPHVCSYCWRIFEHDRRVRGMFQTGPNLTDHLMDCDVRRGLREIDRRAHLERLSTERRAP